jgi:hypothetical protein
MAFVSPTEGWSWQGQAVVASIGLNKSVDGGDMWTPPPSFSGWGAAFTSANDGWAIGSTLGMPVNVAGLYRTTEGGARWVLESENAYLTDITFDSQTDMTWVYGADFLLRQQTQRPSRVAPAGKLPTRWAAIKGRSDDHVSHE